MKITQQLRRTLRTRHYSPRAELAYVDWLRRFVQFHGLRNPAEMAGIDRAKQPSRLPVVLTPGEVRAVLTKLRGDAWLVAALLYGSGLRLTEALTLRVKDVDLERQEVRLRRAKGRRTG